MGLDITAHTRATYLSSDSSTIPDEEDDYRAYDDWYGKHKITFALPQFVQSARGLVNEDIVTHNLPVDWFPDGEVGYDIYKLNGEGFRFRAGSYVGYGVWRNTVRLFSGIGEGQECYEHPTWHKDKPFYELVWFSDCEGTIGPEAASDLLRDFRENRADYEKWVGADNPFPAWKVEGYMHNYDNWTRAFELASDGGMVDFH